MPRESWWEGRRHSRGLLLCNFHVTSGLRFGTPAVTTRGFKEAECKELAGWICDILADLNNEAVIDAVREKVKAICKKLPVYGA